jgi:hypothetical protein
MPERGWQNFDASDDSQAVSFSYPAPEVSAGNGNYVGIIPMGAPVDVAKVSVSLNQDTRSSTR